MFGSFNDAEEYEPLAGSARMSSTRKKAIGFGVFGVALLLVFGVVANSGTARGAALVQTQNAVTEATDAIVHQENTSAEDSDTAVADVYSTGQFDLIYNIFSLGVAAQGSATVFFFFQFTLVSEKYRTAMVITGLVTLIAFYHYMRIFNSFNEAYVSNNGVITATGIPFNDAYRYVDWLLTVPLLLTELILVMNLSAEETFKQCIKLGGLAALMIILGYPGEISEVHSTRWIFWAAAMIPFLIIVYTLFFGLQGSIDAQPIEARGLVRTACLITVISWCTYPIVFIFPMVGLDGFGAKCAVQVGYSVADIIAKPIMGICCWMIASRKSAIEKAEI